MSKNQVSEDIWYSVLDENGYLIYHTPNKKEADMAADALKGDVVPVPFDDLTRRRN